MNRRIIADVVFLPADRPPPLSHYDQPRVFFDAGDATVSEVAEMGLRQALSYYRPGEFRLVINAHTDTEGGVEANQRLSELRAEEVAHALVRLGALWDDIEMVGHGETQLGAGISRRRKRTAQPACDPERMDAKPSPVNLPAQLSCRLAGWLSRRGGANRVE